MEYTIKFTKSSMEEGKETIHETTICESDETKLKREITKIAKTLDPFQTLQAECPIPWESYSYGYGGTKTFNKKWCSYMQDYPLENDRSNVTNYIINVSPTSYLLQTADKKVCNAWSHVKEAYKEITNNTYSFNPDISKIDPELAELVLTELPDKIEALSLIIDTVQRRFRDKIQELNNKE